jgi:flagellum-specific peptidoglycan hydrolase FlgJ
VARRRERGEAVPIYTDENNPNPGQVPWRGREHFSRLGWFLAICGVLGLFLGSYSLYRNSESAACQAKFNETFAAAMHEQVSAGAVTRDATRIQREVSTEQNQAFIDAIKHPATDPAAAQKVRDDFVAKSQGWNDRLAEAAQLDQAAEQKRQQNPLPDQPDC